MYIIQTIASLSDHPLWKKQIQARTNLRDVDIHEWVVSGLYSLVWWLQVILFFSLWFIWWKRVDKAWLIEIAIFGFMISIISAIVDMVGVQYTFWGYPNKLAPLVPPLIITDFCILPIFYMLIYQRFVKWKHYIISTLFLSTFINGFMRES